MLMYATTTTVQVMCRPHLLTILYVNQQLINKVPDKGNGGSPDPFLTCLQCALRKKGLAHETTYM